MASRLMQLRMIVSGRVQGVGFRYATVHEAEKLGLKGWVRNLPSGEVEIVAEGGEEALGMLVSWARRGPRAARVGSVHEEWSENLGHFAEFRIR